MPLFKANAIVIGQFFTRANRADALNHDAVLGRILTVFFQHGLAVGVAAVVDPARDIALAVAVNDVMLIEREQESVAAIGVAVSMAVGLRMRHAQPAVLDEFLLSG